MAPAESATGNNTRVLRELPYQSATAIGDPRQTLDLYLPPRTPTKPPLLVFIRGGFWTTPEDAPESGAYFAEEISRRNVAVALVRYRLAPVHRHHRRRR